MTTIVVSIGRNTRDGQLTYNQWLKFRESLDALIRRHGVLLFHSLVGLGEWEGQQEDSHAVIGIVNPVYVNGLKAEALALAAEFEQDAIGWVVSNDTTVLSTANNVSKEQP